jgi:hypothetical protein
VAEHSIEAGHNIDFKNITILDKVTGYMDRIVREAIEMRLQPNNFNNQPTNQKANFGRSLAQAPDIVSCPL